MRGSTADKAWRIAPFITFLCLLNCGPETSTEAAPEFIGAMNRGKAYFENRDWSLAIQAFEQALTHAPNSAPALRNLARGQLMALDLAPLAETLERARALEPDSVATHYLSGLRHARLAEFERAIPYFEEAVRLDPQTAALRFQLANAYQATGRHEKAAEQFRATSEAGSVPRGRTSPIGGLCPRSRRHPGARTPIERGRASEEPVRRTALVGRAAGDLCIHATRARCRDCVARWR